MVPTNPVELFVNQVCYTPQSSGLRCEGIGMGRESEGNVARTASMNIWATSSSNLPVPSGPHLIMECCCAHPALWLGGSDGTQFMMGKSGIMVT